MPEIGEKFIASLYPLSIIKDFNFNDLPVLAVIAKNFIDSKDFTAKDISNEVLSLSILSINQKLKKFKELKLISSHACPTDSRQKIYRKGKRYNIFMKALGIIVQKRIVPKDFSNTLAIDSDYSDEI